MQLNEILAFPIFKQSTLMTPSDLGLDNRVDSVMVLEGTDIDYWGRENELLLTSYFALIDLEPQEVQKFFEQLAAISTAGLVIKVDRLINQIPPSTVKLCQKHNIPLIRIPESVRYKDIMLAINEPLLNKQNHVLKSYYDASSIYNNLPIAETTFESIITKLSQLVNRPVEFSMVGKNVEIFVGDAEFFKGFLQVKEDKLESQFTQNLYTMTTWYNEETEEYCYSVNSTVQNQLVSDFSLRLFYQSFDKTECDADLMVVENTVHLIRQKLQINQLLKQEKFMLKNNLTASILQSTTKSAHEYAVLLDEANISSYSHYQLVGFMNDEGGTTTPTNQKLNYFRSLGIPHIYYEHNEYFIIIFNIEPGDKRLTKDFLRTHLPKRIDNSLVLSKEGSSDAINQLFNECLDLLNYKKKFDISGILVHDDLGVFRYLSNMDTVQMQEMVPAKLLALYHDERELFDTLVELFHQNMNYTAAADVLYIHPKTVRYRIDKLEELLGVDFKDSMQFTNYFIYVSIIQLTER